MQPGAVVPQQSLLSIKRQEAPDQEEAAHILPSAHHDGTHTSGKHGECATARSNDLTQVCGSVGFHSQYDSTGPAFRWVASNQREVLREPRRQEPLNRRPLCTHHTLFLLFTHGAFSVKTPRPLDDERVAARGRCCRASSRQPRTPHMPTSVRLLAGLRLGASLDLSRLWFRSHAQDR